MQTYINSVISTRDKEFTEMIKIVMNAHKYGRMYNNASKHHKDMKQHNMNDHDEHHEHMCCCRL